ncbi:MAG TPA: hypothetical protein VIX73_19515 [Kofleriaceae bacterium]
MKKIKKLSLGRETIRTLTVGPLAADHDCSVGNTGCTACPPPRPSLANTQCIACATDICTFDDCGPSIIVVG